jgi:hypothetical protein
MAKRTSVWLVVLNAALFLAACGGGGEGGGGGSPPNPSSPPTFDDRLGLNGQASGTATMAVNTPTAGHLPAALLDDQHRALTVWFGHPVDNRRLLWQRRDANGPWSALSELDAAFTFTLRGRPDGEAVLGRTTSGGAGVLRFSPATGWSAAIDVPEPHQPMSKHSDLRLMSNGDIVLSRTGAASTPSGLKTHSFRVLRHRPSAGWETLLETPATDNPNPAQHSYLATSEDGSAVFFWIHTEPVPGGFPVHTLNLQSIDLSSGVALGALPFAQGVYTPCLFAASALVAANSSRFKVLAVPNAATLDGGSCNLDLVRVDFNGITIRRDRINTPGTLTLGTPFLAMSRQGDAIAMWIEIPIGGTGERLLWSQSLAGGGWSEPQPVLTENAGLGEITDGSSASSTDSMVGFDKNVVFAANADGQVAGVLWTRRNGRNYLITGKFGFATGWVWQPAANVLDDEPAAGVAVDSAGTGMLVYSATPCQRAGNVVGFDLATCRPAEAFALEF